MFWSRLTLEFLFRHNSSISMTAATIHVASPPLYTPLMPYTRSRSFFWIPLQLAVSLKMIDTCRSSAWWKHLHEFSTGKYWQLFIFARSGATSVPVYSAPAKQSNPAATVKIIAETTYRFKWKKFGISFKEVQTLQILFSMEFSPGYEQFAISSLNFPGYGDSGFDFRSRYPASDKTGSYDARQIYIDLYWFIWSVFNDSCDQHPCKCIGTKGSVFIRKEFNSHSFGLVHQHRRGLHQYGCRDVMRKQSIHCKR